MRVRSLGVAIVLVGLVWAGLASASSAAVLRGGSVWAGGRAFLAVDLGAPASTCRLEATGPQRARELLSVVRVRQRRVEWIWTVPARARSARWRISAACGANRLSASLVVHGGRRAVASRRRGELVLAVARRVRVVQLGGVLAAVPPVRPRIPATAAVVASVPLPPTVLAQAQVWWLQSAASILTTFHTGAAAGQCTDFVSALRPDVIQRGDTWAYGRFLMAGGGALSIDWTAKNWLANAQQAGMATGRVPQIGAVMVFQPGAYGAFSDGHVAIVSAVHGDGSFTISEMHAPVVGQLTSRNFDAPTALTMASDPRIGFIYR